MTYDEIYARLFMYVKEKKHWDDARIVHWFQTKNPQFGGNSPSDYIRIEPDNADRIIEVMLGDTEPRVDTSKIH